MSGIVLSASVRQNLLSLQSTADLLSTTQNRLATGKKVNTALDNPTNYLHRAGLDNRASDINNLLDGIGNGVQVLQAANTGITSLQKLVDTAKSIANQVLQAPGGYSTKANVDVDRRRCRHRSRTAADLTMRGTTRAASVITFKTATGTLAVDDRHRRSAPAAGTATSTRSTQLNSGAGFERHCSDRVDLRDGRHARPSPRPTTRRARPSPRLGTAPRPAQGSRYPAHRCRRPSARVNAAVADAASQTIRAQPGGPVQRHHPADHDDRAGCFVQRHQPAERRRSQADLQRDRQVHPEHQGRDLQRGGPWPCFADRGHGLPGQRLGQRRDRQAQRASEHAAVRRPRRWVRTCRSCRSARTSTRT